MKIRFFFYDAQTFLSITKERMKSSTKHDLKTVCTISILLHSHVIGPGSAQCWNFSVLEPFSVSSFSFVFAFASIETAPQRQRMSARKGFHRDSLLNFGNAATHRISKTKLSLVNTKI